MSKEEILSRIYDWFPWRLQQRLLYRISFWCKRRYDKRLAQRMGVIPYQRFVIWDDLAWLVSKTERDPLDYERITRIPDSWLSHVAELERIKDILFDTPECQEACNAWSSANMPPRSVSELASQSKAKTGAEQTDTQEITHTQRDLTDILPTDHMED
jgi:hypothetical protein